MVDDEDYEYLNQFKWYILKDDHTNYAVRYEKTNHGYEVISMGREILGVKGKMTVDHRDHNGLNNQRYNLRIGTYAQNLTHRKPYGKSKYHGVHVRIYESNNTLSITYRAGIGFNKKTIHLGTYRNEVDAAKAYDEMAEKLYGEFAILNFK